MVLISFALADLIHRMRQDLLDQLTLANSELEARVQERTHELLTTVTMLPLGLIKFDAWGRCTFVNREWSMIAGRTAKDAMGSGWKQAVHPDDVSLAEAWRDPSLAPDGQVDFRIVRPDGSFRYVTAILTPLRDDHGSLLGLLGTCQDCTQAKATEEQLEKQRLVSAHGARMAALGEMAGGIAHEINNPLAIIHGKARQLRRRREAGELLAPERDIADLLQIEGTADRIAKIIKGLKAFARSDDGDLMTASSIREIIAETTNLCSERMRSMGVDLRVGDIVDVVLICRPYQIVQVLMNLLNNALDAIALRPDPWIEIGTHGVGEAIVVYVMDCGIGIPEHVRTKMMAPFFTTKEIGKGTGLGLSISKGIIEDHGGQLRYDESFGHTCFEIVLPLKGVAVKRHAA
jgi:PAS domain S-box-containing protein